MIKTTSIMELADGTEITLPMSEEKAKSLFCIELKVSGVSMSGTPSLIHHMPSEPHRIHVTAEQLGVGGLKIPEVRVRIKNSIEDDIYDFLSELGVRFED